MMTMKPADPVSTPDAPAVCFVCSSPLDEHLDRRPCDEVASALEAEVSDDPVRGADFLALSEVSPPVTVLAWSSPPNPNNDDEPLALTPEDHEALTGFPLQEGYRRADDQRPIGLIRGADGIWRDRLAAKVAEAERVPGLEVELDRLRSERDRAEFHAARAEKIAAARQVQIDDLTLQLGAVQAELLEAQRASVPEATAATPPEIRRLNTGAIDEIVGRGVNVHLEMMDRDFVWLGIYGPGGEQLHVDVTAVIPPRRKRPVIRIVTSADPPEVDGAKRTRSKR